MTDNYVSCYKPTDDHWCGTWEGSYVYISFFKFDDKQLYGVSACGDDDLSLSIETTDYNEGLEIFLKLMELTIVNFKDVRSLGLTSD